ncbi:MAG: hypothetical protein OK457_00400 [Thaumarchaeota archaeon]|nr:hypothetical protein [Nitrososphaerota archaeon]
MITGSTDGKLRDRTEVNEGSRFTNDRKAEARKPKSRFGSFARYLGLIIFLSTLAVYLATLNEVWATDHSTAIVEFQYSVWANHSFILGKVGSFDPKSVDVFQYNGNYFMANAPGVAFFTLPFAIIGFLLNGHFTQFGSVLLLTEAPIAFANSLGSYFVYKISNYYFKKEISAFVAFSYAFSTISWPFAGYLFQSDVSSLFDLIAIFLVIKFDRANTFATGQPNNKTGTHNFILPFLCGLAIACATFVDYVNGILIPIIALYLLFGMRKKKLTTILKSVFAFLSSSVLVTLFSLGLYNYLSFGTLFTTSEQLFLHSSSVFANFNFPVHLGVFLNLFTPMRGLFSYSPILLLGVWGMWKMLRNSHTDREALLFLSIFLGILGLYSSWYDPLGGLSFGPRLIISSIPFLLIPAGFVISEANGKYSYTFAYLLFATGVVVNGIAALVGVLAPPSDNWFSSPFLSSTLPSFISGNLDVWWKSYLGDYWMLLAAFLLGTALLLPLSVGYVIDSLDDKLG